MLRKSVFRRRRSPPDCPAYLSENGKVRAQIVRQAPKANYAVLSLYKANAA